MKYLLTLIFLFIVMGFAIFSTPYLYCLYREPWNLTGQSIEEFERTIYFYTKEDITLRYEDPSLDSWAKGSTLSPGNKLIRYNIFYSQPLDVLMNSENEILEYFTSYE